MCCILEVLEIILDSVVDKSHDNPGREDKNLISAGLKVEYFVN